MKYSKPLLFVLCLIPFIFLITGIFTSSLGANPIEEITHHTGEWTLRFLILTLAVTPLAKLINNSGLVRYRRMLGLYSFFYASLHFLTYLILDQFFDWELIIEDIVERPYITVGFTGFVLLIPLAITSTGNMMRKLGKRWKKLHRLIYIIGIAGILHYLWLVKADILEPVIYGVIYICLMILRLPYLKIKKQKSTTYI